MQVRALLSASLIALLGVSAAQAQPALADAPQGRAQSFPTKCGVESLAAGREGNVWFACTVETNYGYGTRVRVGRLTAAGKVTEFGGRRFPRNTEPGPIGVASNGDLWFPLNGFFRVAGGRRPAPRLARVTPSGRVTIHRVSIGRKYDILDLVAGPSDYLWFSTATHLEANDPALWQISPDGTISRLPVTLGDDSGLEVGPEGDLWFTRKPASGAATEAFARLAPGGEVTEFGSDIPGFAPGPPIFAPTGGAWFLTGGKRPGVGQISATGEITETGAKLDAEGGIIAGLTVGSDGNLWFGFRAGTGTSAIGRVTANGQVTAFTHCMRYSQPYFGPASLVTGADGNVYFTSVASRELPAISDPPSIGRITPSGEIAQLYAGVHGEARWILAGPDGAIWFSAGLDEIQRIAPLTGPINTFRVARLRRASAGGAATARVVVPGPGTLVLKPVAFVPHHHKPVPVQGQAATATSTACGPTRLPVKPVGAAKRAFHKRGFATETVAVTFTPTGGSPYTETAKLYFYGGKPHESGSHQPATPPPPGKHRGEPLRVPQAGRNFPIRPPTLRFSYQPPGSYGDEEPPGRPLYPPFWITGLGHWREWHRREERHGVPARAISDGWIHYDTCDPNCPHGRYAVARAHVELDGEFLCTKGPNRIFETFERITVRVEGGPPRTRFIQCTGRLRSGRRSTIIPPGVGFYR
jgi:streptogramin lyase